MKKLKFLIFVLIISALSLSVCKGQAKSERMIIMPPYLQAVTKNSIAVMVESTSKNTIYCQFGTDSVYDKTAETWYIENTTEGTFMHRIKLDRLSPDTKYYYKINCLDTLYQGTFYTALESGADFRFAVMGDCRSNPEVSGKIASMIAEHEPRFSIYTGDICDDEDYESWKEEFFTSGQLSLARSTPFFNAVGNHEDWAQNTEAFTQAPVDHTLNAAYYSFDYGDIHFLVISSEHDLDDDSEQYEFIKNDLAKTDKKWKIVAVHVPPYGAGGHGEDGDMKDIAEELLEPAGVDILLAGHSHFYQHNFVNGIHHFILAGGGAPLYTPRKKDYVVKSAKKHHYAIFDVYEDKVNIDVIGLDGEKIDNIEIVK